MIARYLKLAREEARRIVRDQEIGRFKNYEDIAAESCEWVVKTGVLRNWEIRNGDPHDDGPLRELARRSVFLRMMQARRAATSPAAEALPFDLIFDDEDGGFDIIDPTEGTAVGARRAEEVRGALRRREASEVSEIACEELRHLLWKRWAEVVAGLPDGVRACVELVCREGMSYVEAADKLGLRPSTVRMRVERHRASIRRALGDEFRELL